MTFVKSLNVLEVVQSLQKGGRTMRFTATVAGLRQNNHCVTAACLSCPEPWVKIPNLEVIDGESTSRWQLISQLRRVIIRDDIQVIHAHCELSQLYAGIAGFTCGVPTIGTFHRSDLKKYQPSKVNTLIKWLLSHYIAVSHDRLSLLTHNLALPSKKCHVVHGGAIVKKPPTKATAAKARDNLNIPNQQLVLLSVGHLGTIKGHQDTIAALVPLTKEYKNLHLYIAGDGSSMEKKTLNTLVKKLTLEQHVTFLGQINNVEQWFEACDIFVQPPIEEAFGLVFAEAGAKAKPVVATNVGGIKEIIIDGETGLLVAPAAPEELSLALRKLASSADERKRLGENGYQRISTQFSINSMINKYLTIFNTVIN
ncbi:Glycosyltransferase involved in cell wall bisynthesis [Colwellia chukchiensis]|uniref:Glycosyltransferase involved in cell wall bisynthesis n=1 Tax=Colwellia chukchiensis TaxID=641665 RepID=A0A1H7SHR9_9GAMM|nr:glycosyltransferase family 4 protein [Colwellia chukchiensis]SEL71017.1 Glycosyltransferase involved in cell wall bisynthesis [Colwellia chukchiensis]